MNLLRRTTNRGCRPETPPYILTARKYLTAAATESQYTDRNVKVHITELNGVYFMKYETKTQLTEGHAALQMYIIGQSYVLLDDLVRKTCGPDTVPVAFNTDAFKAINMRPLDFPETPTFGDIRKEAKVTVRVSRRRVAGVMRVRHDPEEDPDLDKRTRGAEDLLVRGGVVIGPAGSGKTTKLVELYNECKTAGKRVAVLTPTHGAKKNLCARGVTDAMTIDKYYGKVKDANVRINPLKACDEDVIFVDEFSMITYDWYHVFMQAKLAKPALVFVFFGDDNQCDAVTKYKCRIVETSVMQFVCGYNLVRLQYIAATGRYTEETKVELDKLLNNGTWEHYQPHWPAVGTDIPFNFVFTNELRRKLNQKACETYCSALPRKDIVEIAGRKFAVGMPLVCFDNITALGFNNNDMFTITGFARADGGEVEAVLVHRGRNGKKQHKIERSWFSKKMGENYVFEHYWASTVNRVQGITLHGKYNVHEIYGMPLNHLYTALSRTVDYRLVAVGEQRKTDFVWREKPCSPQKMISPKKADLQGVIYRIDDGSQWYVGKTVVRDGETYETAVVRRFKEHHDKPTCDKMREWLKSAQDATIGVVKSGYYMSDYQLDRFETLVLTHESINRTEGCMNTQKVVGIAPEIKIAKLGNESKQIAECMQAALKASKPTVTFDKLVSDGAIKIDPKKKRYRVSYIEGGKTKRKEFYYRDGTETGVQNVAVDFYKTMMKV